MSDVIQKARVAYARLVEGDSDNPLRVAKANEIYAGNYDDEILAHRIASSADLRSKLDVAVEALKLAERRLGNNGFISHANDVEIALATIGGNNEQG